MRMFSDEKYIVLETFKKNGDSVKTPVWFVKHDDLIWIVTRELTGKVKRLQNNKNVNIAISNFSGKPKKEWIPGIAKKIEGELANEIISLRNKKYGFMSKIVGIFSKKKGNYVVYSININKK